ncbi:unnamed protein product [Prunus brigantina]
MFVSWHDGHISVFPRRPHLSIVGFSLSLDIFVHFFVSLTPLILVCNRGFSLPCISAGFSFLREPRQRLLSLLYPATLPVFPLHSPRFFLCVADLVLATQALSLCCCLGIGLSCSISTQHVFSSPLNPNLFL